MKDTLPTASLLREQFASGARSAEDIVREHLDRIAEREPRVDAFLTVLDEQARERARTLDARRAAGAPLGMLAGVPVALKDNICTRGVRTTCGAKMLAGFVPPYDAHVVERLLAEDAVIIGKANMDEFAMGSSTENSAFKITKNPWDPARIPGGSSGGSAAAVAAGMAPLALGSDTGGSIRQPAALCGVVGLKPTYGRVSRYGVIAFASSLDQVGPFARTARDAALLLQAIAAPDERDSTCARTEPDDYLAQIDAGVDGMTFGLPREFFLSEGMDPEVSAAVDEARRTFETLGVRFVDISLPHSRIDAQDGLLSSYALATYYVLATAEASSNLARFDGVKYGHRSAGFSDMVDMYAKTREEGFGDEVKRRIMLGTYALSAGYYDAYFLKAARVRRLIKEDFDRAFEQVDVVLGPTAPQRAFHTGERAADPLAMYMSDIFTIPCNLAGICGISVPCGFTRSGLPIGVQLMATHWADATLLRAAHAFQSATDHHLRTP
ncbi:MAG: Asp-tRNA(Asn)/Glu-tRNA(Gln) amidotransferase subunit GatA [Candidatus Brocadiaceae bacterium]|nr:Asp-tRNA(Asn)/Glu-tRNA(Gln) amidotransferase subunit GatA [Candidatus Brocadiaceae bacterium]